MLRYIRNICWLLFGGLFASMGLLLANFLHYRNLLNFVLRLPDAFAMTIPFDKRVRRMEESYRVLKFADILFNSMWFVSVGWLLSLNHIFFGVLLSLSIVGLPLARQHWKLLPLSAFPLGKSLVSCPAKQESAPTAQENGPK